MPRNRLHCSECYNDGPQMRTFTKHALFASIVAEFKGVIDAENVPIPYACRSPG
jgi:hypothetical protein